MADSSSELHLEIETLERKHAENPEGRFFVPLANAYRKMGDVETAEALLRNGVERHPDYLSAHIVLGRCLADRGELKGAEDEFRFVLSRDPQNLIALRTLGELAVGDGRPAEAAEWYRELLAVDPMNEEARQALDTLSSAPEPNGANEPEQEDWWGGSESGATEVGLLPEMEGLERGSSEELTAFGVEEDPDSADAAAPEQALEDDPPVGEAVAEDPDEEAPFSISTPEVVTETIAELYTRQGLHDRAAAVYRELIRRRGGDPALDERLARVERLARGESAEEETTELVLADEEAMPTPSLDVELEAPVSEVPEGSTGDEDDDFFAASVAAGLASLELDDEFTGDAGTTDTWSEASTGSVEKTVAGEGTIAAFLAGLAGWRPAAGPAALLAGNLDEGEPWEQVMLDDEIPLSSSEAVPEAGEAVGAFESTHGGETTPDDLSYLEPDAGPASRGGTAPADDEPFPWELSDASTDAGTPFSATSTGDEAPPPGDERGDVERGVAAGGADDSAGIEPAGAADAADAGETDDADGPRPAADAGEDEDLESFQAWLRSLKR